MRLPRRPHRARLEMLALMDVVFLILVFLVYAMLSMTLSKGMPVNLPAASTVRAETNAAIALTIREDGSLWLEREQVSLADLPERVRSEMASRAVSRAEEPVIQIFADASLAYQKLFNVLDALKNAGLNKISLQGRLGD